MENELENIDPALGDKSGVNVELAAKRDEPVAPEGHLTVDVYQTEDDVVVQSTIAGANKEDIDIAVTPEMVTIKGRRRPEYPVKLTRFDHQELYWGPFSRAIILPVDIDADNAQASYKNGILTIRMPKLEKARTKKVKISQ